MITRIDALLIAAISRLLSVYRSDCLLFSRCRGACVMRCGRAVWAAHSNMAEAKG